MPFLKTVLPGLALVLLFQIVGCAPLSKIRPTSYQDPVTGMEFVSVPAGNFLMGDPLDRQQEGMPVHKVSLKGFYVSKYETTFEQYDRFCEETGRDKPDDMGWGRGNRPVINVSWNDASAYSHWLATKTGLQISLSSEAQWEYMARAGTKTDFWMGKTPGNNLANCSDCGSTWSNQKTAPVGSFPPNSWGIYDTVGNVAEWTRDHLHDSYNGAPKDGTAWLEGKTTERIIRGVGWNYSSEDAGVAVRNWAPEDEKSDQVGFRLVIAADPKTGAPLPAESAK